MRKSLSCKINFVRTSDVSRLSFIVKSVIGNTFNFNSKCSEKSKSTKSKWISDKNGVYFTDLIIKPMFEIIKDQMKDYIKRERLEESEIRDVFTEDITIKLTNMQLAGELIRAINLHQFNGKVLKYVAPYFNLNLDNECSDFEDNEIS